LNIRSIPKNLDIIADSSNSQGPLPHPRFDIDCIPHEAISA
jgi:hypothetical protein